MQLNKVNEANTRRVLQQIWISGGTTRVALAKELGLVKSTVSRIISMLLDDGIVRQTAPRNDRAGVGRTPVRLEINRRHGMIVGLELQTDFYNAVAIDITGAVIRTWSGSISMSGKDTMAAFFEITERINPWIESSEIPLIGMGIALAGLVDQNRGAILQSNPLSITEPVEFVQAVENRVSGPVMIGNDANCGCWSELVSRRNSRHDNFLFVLGEFRAGQTTRSGYWGIAIGLGLVLNGGLYHGASYSAGEFQSILWEPGNDGQLSITNDEARRLKEDPSVMVRALRELCSHVAFLVNTLNLTNVLFGGEITEYREMLRPILEEEIQRNWSYPNRVACDVEFSSLGVNAVAYGAAGMVLANTFTVPDVFSG